MSAAPHYAEALVGFRAWRPDADGSLVPWTMAGAPWRPGVNEAQCLAGGGGRRHLPPGHSCTCGLYALSRLDDPRLDPATAAVGSIAAWGAIEVHAAGFRARFAAITAIALPERAARAHRAALEAAAERYAVPLVEPARLVAHAGGFGAALAFNEIPPAGSGAALTGPTLEEHGARGIAVEDHVWVEVAPPGLLALGITAALAGEIAIGSPLRPAPLGPARRAGDTLATIGDGDDALLVRAPVDLAPCELNPRLAADPDLVRTDPERDGWLLRAFALDWERQAGAVVWGRRAATVYRASVAHDARREDPFGWVKPAFLARQPQARSAADAIAILAAERDRPRFADATAVEARIGGRVARALAHPGVRERAARARVRLALRLHRPEADLVIDLGPPGAEPVTLYTDADSADLFLAGRLDIAGALRSRRIQTDAEPARVLVVASLIKELQRAYREEQG